MLFESKKSIKPITVGLNFAIKSTTLVQISSNCDDRRWALGLGTNLSCINALRDLGYA